MQGIHHRTQYALLLKKEKALVWYYVDLKSLPEGFYSLIILAFPPLNFICE